MTEETKPPSKILAFDSLKDRVPKGVDLDSPFFEIARPDYEKCQHRNRGVRLDTATRTSVCLCGVTIDNFDALLIYAHAQQRLVERSIAIKEYERKEAEKKALGPFVKHVNGWSRRMSTNGRKLLGYYITLQCNHRLVWLKKRAPRTATCRECFNESEKTKRADLREVSRIGTDDAS